MSDWKTEPLDECLEALLDYRGKSPPRSENGIPVLSAKVVKTTGLLRPIEQKIAIDYYTKWMVRGFPRAGDVVMTTEAPMGEVIQLDAETVRYALGQRIVCMRGKSKKLDNTFLRYLLTSPVQQAILASYATGTTVLGISQKALRSVPISYPSLGEQKRIGELLGALDDKIELNRRMNETLEAMARAIFKDWFVDFGPTRTKMAMRGEDPQKENAARAPYLAPDIWSLFPDRLDDDGKPEGWDRVPLRELMEVNPQEPLPRGRIAPYLDMASIPTTGPNPTDFVLRKYGSGMRFRNGDALLARITPCLENGKTAFVQNLPDNEVGWGSTEFIVLRSHTPVPNSVAYIVARDPLFRAMAIRSMTGTSGRQRASSEAVSAFALIQPSNDEVWTQLGRVIGPMFERIAANAEESRTLAATRDLLLPKLMSGDLRVRDAEKIVEAVA